MPQFGNVVTVASYKCCNKKIRNNLSHTVALIPNKIRVLRNILYFMRNLNTYTAPRAKTCDSSPFSDWDWFSLGFFGGLRYCLLPGQYASRFGYLPAANTPHIGLRYCPLPGQYASRFGYLPAANTPHINVGSGRHFYPGVAGDYSRKALPGVFEGASIPPSPQSLCMFK